MNAVKSSKATEPAENVLADEDDEALPARLEKEGLVRRGQAGPIPPELLQPGPKCKNVTVLNALIDDRRSGREVLG